MMLMVLMSNFTCKDCLFNPWLILFVGKSKKSQNSLKLENDTKAEVQ